MSGHFRSLARRKVEVGSSFEVQVCIGMGACGNPQMNVLAFCDVRQFFCRADKKILGDVAAPSFISMHQGEKSCGGERDEAEVGPIYIFEVYE